MKLYAQEESERISIYQGLNELQADFLKEELRKDFTRPITTLRRIAKRRAFIQQLKWDASDVFFALTACGAFLAAYYIINILNS